MEVGHERLLVERMYGQIRLGLSGRRDWSGSERSELFWIFGKAGLVRMVWLGRLVISGS